MNNTRTSTDSNPGLVHPLQGVRADQSSETLRSTEIAFTRVDLLIVIAVIVLLAAVVLPALANNRFRSDRVICANNLRQIGMAMQLWANDHNELPPYDVPAAEGGTLGHALAPNAWLHFSWVSNELA